MIRVLADSAHDAALIKKVIGGAVQVVNGVGSFTHANARVECVVFACRSPIPPDRLELVREIRREMPWIPVIFVTDPAPEIIRWLEDGAVSEVVWFDNVKTELRSRILASRPKAVPLGLAEEIDGLTLPPTLRSALSHSLRAATDRPVRSVSDLAGFLRCSPVTLSQSFRKNVTGESTLRGFLGALVVLRAHHLRTSGCSWEVASRRVGFTRSTIHERSKRWPGLPLSQLAQVSRERLVAQFISDHMKPLLNEGRGADM